MRRSTPRILKMPENKGVRKFGRDRNGSESQLMTLIDGVRMLVPIVGQYDSVRRGKTFRMEYGGKQLITDLAIPTGVQLGVAGLVWFYSNIDLQAFSYVPF